MGLVVNENIGGIDVNVVFSDNKISIIDSGISGSGKSFLIDLLISYCTSNSISFNSFNSKSSTNLVLTSLDSKDVDILFLDNADLYMTDELAYKLCNFTGVVILSLKKKYNFKFSNIDRFIVDYKGSSIECVRRG